MEDAESAAAWGNAYTFQLPETTDKDKGFDIVAYKISVSVKTVLFWGIDMYETEMSQDLASFFCFCKLDLCQNDWERLRKKLL